MTRILESMFSTLASFGLLGFTSVPKINLQKYQDVINA